MSRIQKRRDLVIAENGFEFFNGERLFGVIAFDEIFFPDLFAQETPRVATGGSGAFQPAVSFHHRVGAPASRGQSDREHLARQFLRGNRFGQIASETRAI
ncbi:MAG: hypothetical protein HOP19_19880 [Acidobacteria bacterium]|nr:hypothetical protein [Acidobacteriota bacterium]